VLKKEKQKKNALLFVRVAFCLRCFWSALPLVCVAFGLRCFLSALLPLYPIIRFCYSGV
jgi:hypothetical protein